MSNSNDQPAVVDYVEHALSKMRVVTVNDTWYHYRDGCYHETEEGIISRMVAPLLPRKAQRIQFIKTVTDTLKVFAQIRSDHIRGAVTMREGTVLINLANGVLAVRADGAKFSQHSPDYLFTRKLASAWNPEADCPLFRKCLASALPDQSDQELLRWFAGYFLYPSCEHNVFLVLYGPYGGEGKSTLIDTIGSVLGGGLVGRTSLSQLCSPTGYYVPYLRQYLVNIGSELKADEIGEADALKILCEGRPITAREIGGKPFNMAGYTCKLVFCSNHLPRFKSGTGAEARRMKLLHFATKQAPDGKLQGKLANEVEGIFARFMVPALQEILRGRTCPEGGGTSRIALQKFAVVNDPVTTFLNAYCQFGRHLSIRKSELVNSWAAFVEEHHLSEKLIRGTAFFRRLYELRTDLDTSRPRRGESRVQMMHGIGLRPEAPRKEPNGYERVAAALEESPELDVGILNARE